MNNASLYIGLSILALIILPFLVSYYRKKNRSIRETTDFIAYGFKYGLELQETEILQHLKIGMDPQKRKLLVCQSTEESIIELDKIKSVDLVVHQLQSGESQTIDQVILTIKMRENSDSHVITFYDSQLNEIFYNELNIGEKWKQNIQMAIK